MQWTMPHRVLQLVATVIVVVALGAFSFGIYNAPQRGRLPGERSCAGGYSTTPPVQAIDATPLTQERIEGPPPPAPLTPEQKAQADADKAAKAEGDAAKLAASGATPPAKGAAPTAAPTIAPPPPVERPAAEPAALRRAAALADHATPWALKKASILAQPSLAASAL